MKGEGNYKLVWPELRGETMTKGGVADIIEELAPLDLILFAQLKELRNRLAKEHGVPPYGVFSNKILEAFTRLRPTSMEAGMRIKGVGEVKAERYLEAFLELLRKEAMA